MRVDSRLFLLPYIEQDWLDNNLPQQQAPPKPHLQYHACCQSQWKPVTSWLKQSAAIKNIVFFLSLKLLVIFVDSKKEGKIFGLEVKEQSGNKKQTNMYSKL